MATLSTHAESMANQAEKLFAFQGINLLHIKNQVELMLDLIGKNGLFSQYSSHNIKHVDQMLDIINWLIPDVTKENMTKADWLLLVLSFYFHDLGMLVTNDEFSIRHEDDHYIKYKQNIMANPTLKEFKDKINQMSEDEREKFIYQDYVRSIHATRIGNWIEGRVVSSSQGESTIIAEINSLLGNLSQMFKEDLSLICKSHELDDLDNFEKYKPKVRYGNTPQESANVHYIAIILRTADLLHITQDRTPSVQFSLINPSDPLSVREWQKQMAITAVQPKDSADENGNLNPKLEKNTIEVSGFFAEPELADAYFSLRSYIEYCAKQLQNSYEIIQKSKEKYGTGIYQFPWNNIFDGDIITKGFDTRKLQFEIDKENILKLLVGNTLYNDSSVVIRELIQNSLDAIKLQKELIKSIDDFEGKIEVSWNEQERKLTIFDNGTGMSLPDINNYLLKVGASKYRSPEFIKNHPDFHSISRFGIGILTCFMIAEDIDIISSVCGDNSFSAISIRKISGKYLLKNDDKGKCDERIRAHGTIITLKVRHDVNMNDLLEQAKRWIVAPLVPVNVIINGQKNRIGNDSIKSSIIDYLTENHISVDGIDYDVRYFVREGIEYAYALKYSSFLKEWSFITIDSLNNNKKLLPIGICVEGIRVEFDSPGLDGQKILALVNARGESDVQTNVARTAIESNEPQKKIYSAIYDVYADHIESQIRSLSEAGCSIVTFASEAQYLAQPLFSDRRFVNRFTNKPLLESALHKIKCVAIEFENKHELKSVIEIQEFDKITIIDSHLIRRISLLLQDSLTEKTPADVIDFIGIDLGLDPTIPALCNFDLLNIYHRAVILDKQVTAVQVNKQQRQIHLTFSNGVFWDTYNITDLRRTSGKDFDNRLNGLHIATQEIPIIGLDSDESGLITFNGVYLDGSKSLSKNIKGIIKKFNLNDKREKTLLEIVLSIALNCIVFHKSDFSSYDERELVGEVSNFYMQIFHRELDSDIWSVVSRSEFSETVFDSTHVLYNPLGWTRLRGRMFDFDFPSGRL